MIYSVALMGKTKQHSSVSKIHLECCFILYIRSKYVLLGSLLKKIKMHHLYAQIIHSKWDSIKVNHCICNRNAGFS